jgi:predicted Fe-S protein YdhL (DUF1289 family)
MEQPEPVNQDDIKEALATLAFDVQNLTKKVQELAVLVQPKEEESGDVTSPCVGMCVRVPGRDMCSGCGRTTAEIAGWLFLSPMERQRVRYLASTRLSDARGAISGQ